VADPQEELGDALRVVPPPSTAKCFAASLPIQKSTTDTRRRRLIIDTEFKP